MRKSTQLILVLKDCNDDYKQRSVYDFSEEKSENGDENESDVEMNEN